MDIEDRFPTIDGCYEAIGANS